MVSNICKVCLETYLDLIDIFGDQGRNLNIPEMIKKHFWFEIHYEAETSKLICNRCLEHIINFDTYYKQIEIAHELYEYTGKDTIEVLVPKHEPDENICEILQENNNNKNTSNGNWAVTKTDLSKTEDNKLPVLLEEDRLLTEEIDTNIENVDLLYTNLLENKNVENFRKLSKQYEDELIRKYFDMTCSMCDTKFLQFVNARSHYRQIHQKNGYVTCCNRKFFKRCRVIEHILRHLNPLAFRCTICFKSFSHKNGLRDHMDFHKTSDEIKFQCDMCPKSYAKQFKLTAHKRLNHYQEGDKKFGCDHCGKTFIYKSILRYHIKTAHNPTSSILCEICAKEFKCVANYEQHRLIEHSTVVLPKIRCEICGVWLKHEMTHRSHMLRHKETGETCQYCGKISLNRKALRSHIKRLHINCESHPCSVCGRIFKRKQNLKEHMTQHTGETLYSCTYCSKTFNSSANMYAHRKKAHPKEYEANKGIRCKLQD